MIWKALTDLGRFRLTSFSRLDALIFHFPVFNNFSEEFDQRLHVVVCSLECVERTIRLVSKPIIKLLISV